MCGRRLSACEHSICAGCLRSLPRVDYLGGEHHGVIERLFWGQLPVERATSMFYYQGEGVRRLVHAMKYFNRPRVGRDLGRIFATEMRDTDFFDGLDTIVPMPLHWLRKLERGYNQSEEIARGIADVTGLPVQTGWIRRKRYTQPQARLNPMTRNTNVRDAFELTGKNQNGGGKNILLVDDVLTTGSTLISCGRELARIPGLRLSVFTLAYASQLIDTGEEDLDFSFHAFPV